MRHKHADLIHAWAEGAKIEYKNSAGNWCKEYGSVITWNSSCEYRIKPEKKPDEVGYVGIALADDGCWYLTDAYDESKDVPKTTDGTEVSAILKLTQCGETGKLIKAEVL